MNLIPTLLYLSVGKVSVKQGPSNQPHNNRFMTREWSDREAPSRAQLLRKSTYQHQYQLETLYVGNWLLAKLTMVGR